MISMLDIKAEHAFTVSVGRQGVKLTRAAIRAVTIQEVLSFEHPLDVRHGMPPQSHSRATAQCKLNPTTSKTRQARALPAHSRNKRTQSVVPPRHARRSSSAGVRRTRAEGS